MEISYLYAAHLVFVLASGYALSNLPSNIAPGVKLAAWATYGSANAIICDLMGLSIGNPYSMTLFGLGIAYGLWKWRSKTR